MNWLLWPRRARNGSWAVVGAALGVMAIAACGSVHATGAPAGSGHTSAVKPVTAGSRSAQPALCRQAAAVTRLEVARNHGFKVPELEPAFPNQVTVTDPARIRDLIRALCALPVAPPGLYNCPIQLVGTAYTLRFSVSSRPLPLVTIDSTGCETVTGVGPPRRVISPGFWLVLSKAIGVNTPPVLGGLHPGSPCQLPPLSVRKIESCPRVARPGTGVVASADAAAS